MKFITTLLFAATLTAYEFTEYRPRPLPEEALEVPAQKSFRYFSMGLVAVPNVLELSAADVAFGLRALDRHIALDGCIGSAIQAHYQMLYGQASLLYFPTKSWGPYFGAGVTGAMLHFDGSIYPWGSSGLIQPWINVPITLGYQFNSGNGLQFFQIQATPLLSLTGSFGISF